MASVSSTSLTITWGPASDGTLPGGRITAYSIYMAEGTNISLDDYQLIANISSSSSLTYTASDEVQAGRIYSFKVQARNVNGPGALSSVSAVSPACDSPVFDSPPTLLSLLINPPSILLSWTTALHASGGECKIAGFAVFRDSGNSPDETPAI